MPMPPIMRCKHRGDVLESGRKNVLAANRACETIKRLLVDVRVAVVRRVLRGLRAMLQMRTKDADAETYVRL